MPCCWVAQPSIDQGSVAVPGHLRELEVGLRLLQRRLELIERRLVLRNLVIELRHRQLRQQFSCLDAIADVDVALGDVAGRAGIDVRLRECGRRARQGDRHDGRARLDRRDAHAGHEITLLLGGRHDLLLLRIVSPRAQHEAAGERQESAQARTDARPIGAAPGAASASSRVSRSTGRAFLPIELDHVIPIGGAKIIHRGGPRTRHRPRRRRCACAAWQRDKGR